jgi:Mn-containing catalase
MPGLSFKEKKMFYHDPKLQYKVRVDEPNPLFAKMLQQAIGGAEGELRVCLQYLFQAWGARGPKKYRDMLMETGTEEIAHIEMLATAVALNLEGAPVEMQDSAAMNPLIEAAMGGMLPRHLLSAGGNAMPVDANGVPFNAALIVASGNLAADMYANVMAESTGRLLATRLYEMTNDPGMKDMLSFLIARDTMHQNQWLAVLEELGGQEAVHPIPNSFPQEMENQEFNYAFMSTARDPQPAPDARWVKGPSIDGKGKFSYIKNMQPAGDEPKLAPPDPRLHAQKETIMHRKDGR